jgi:hypothetical protein
MVFAVSEYKPEFELVNTDDGQEVRISLVGFLNDTE